MVKLIQGEPAEGEENALSKRLEKVQFKTLKPLVWKSLTQEGFLSDLSQMGLSSFFRSSFVQGDEALCREFLCSYKKHGSGCVRQEVIQTDPKIVQLVLKLPHTGKAVKEVPKLTPQELYSMYNGPTVKVKHNGFSVKALCDPHFKEFVSFMVDRMSCKVNCTYVSAEILYAAKYVWETKAVLDWAGYMSHRIQAQCEKVRGTSQSAFEYTQYLTQIIHYQLGIPTEEQQLVVDGLTVSADGLESQRHEKEAQSANSLLEVDEGGRNQHAGVNGGEKRLRKQHETKLAAKRPRATSREGSEYALSLLEKVREWVKGHASESEQQKRHLEQQLHWSEKRVAQLEAELSDTKARFEAQQQRQVQWEVQFNLAQQEKLALRDQVQMYVAQQAVLRERLETSEREKAELQAYFSRVGKGKKEEMLVGDQTS